MRDKILKRWVKQPPVSPNIQYLRDAERVNAWEQLGERHAVLDVASESNVTAGLDADHVTRVDFSPDAIEYAREVLGEDVDRYEAVDPEDVVLPFDDDSFDGAVSIGPYDWKFLDIDGLTEEMRRVVAEDGLFSFSVPTSRSPYSAGNRNRFRYYTPDEILAHLSPGWAVEEYDLVFQYPYRGHQLISLLSDERQEPLVDVAWKLTDLLTAADLWDRASYLVLGVTPLKYERYLERGVEALFRPTSENGFWDEEEGKIIRALTYEEVEDGDGFRWSRDDRTLWRYAPFALMGAMQWRVSSRGTDEYDGRIERELAYFETQISGEGELEGFAKRSDDVPNTMPSYGVGPLICAFSLASGVFDEEHLETARTLFDEAIDTYDFDDSEDSLLAYGLSYLYERDPDEELKGALDDALWQMNERLNFLRVFRFENGTTRRHQNQMYALWGMGRTIEVTGKTGYLDSMEQVIDRTIERRMRDDGAFIWEDKALDHRARARATKALGARPPHWDFLYECHQTFFVNAVMHYYAAGGERNYDRELGKAMAWIYGANTLGENLVDLSGIGVPMRQMTTAGGTDVEDQKFKGSYEIGSYLMALTNLAEHLESRR